MPNSFTISDGTSIKEKYEVGAHLSILSLLTVEFLERYPLLKNFMQEFEKIRAVETYLNTRPTLSGIGVEPLLELNGVPTSTSFGRD